MSDEWERARARMVASQLAARGIRDPRVLSAMARVPRERFVPEARREASYEDRALPLAQGATISQPYMVARACELAGVTEEGGAVLDVGTGSGYQAAVLAELAPAVVSIERVEGLARGAAEILDALGYGERVEVIVGDGREGYPARAPYQAILVAAAAPSAPEALLDQLALGGRLVLPIGPRDQQRLTVIERRGERDFHASAHEACVYVPLLPGTE